MISIYIEFRQYTCIEHGESEVTDCRLTFMTSDDEPVTVTESGCFMVFLFWLFYFEKSDILIGKRS